ncbi:hypothetical protein CDAR_219391 [Caerostris darwini]|uniref:Uncharacterized protein n=1 Tax=Caerostris darwini TaxID=1538125 RepID=A0AAV4TG98_9ARAC|nr:hypothetical protein CDAR_219391 [Caerostris darwini]
MTSMAPRNSYSPIQQFLEQEQTYSFNIIREHSSSQTQRNKDIWGEQGKSSLSKHASHRPTARASKYFSKILKGCPVLDLTGDEHFPFPRLNQLRLWTQCHDIKDLDSKRVLGADLMDVMCNEISERNFW